MKRWLILFLILTFLVTAGGCSTESTPPKTPVAFYYPSADPVYDGQTELLHPEARDGAGFENDIAGLLNLYLQGPTSETLHSPFPKGVTVSRYASTANTAIVELSSEFSQLKGIDLTLACASLARTLFDLTQMERVQISATDSQINEQVSITLDRNDLYMVDTPLPSTMPSDPTSN